MIRRLLTLTLASLFVSTLAFAQAAVVQQSATPLNGCSVSHQDAAINTTVTVTITPPSGQYVYICNWDYQVANDGTGTGPAQVNVKWTTTNMGGLAAEYSINLTANLQVVNTFNYYIPVKSAQAGVAVTFVSPAIAAHTAYSANVYYYFGQ
jgi:hypothetical protein